MSYKAQRPIRYDMQTCGIINYFASYHFESITTKKYNLKIQSYRLKNIIQGAFYV